MNSVFFRVLIFGLVSAFAHAQASTQRGAADGHTVTATSDPNTSDSTQPSTAEIVPGRLLLKIDPQYPKEAQKRKIEGAVKLLADVDSDGTIRGLGIVDGDLALAEAAVDAVRGWRFEPYTQSGQSVAVQQELKFNFTSGKKFGEFDTNPAPPALLSQSAKRSLVPPNKVFFVGKGVAPPKAIYSPDPEYDKNARKRKYQGTCLLSMIVDADGRPADIKVVRALGEGLDAKAVEAVSTWKFEPATKDGKPVAVFINVEVSFRLY